ncbi:AfsR/SARP family transcriptional regulator [Actinomadura sp. HBU206391]|uniref:AfsR/SARP family transcriptional regulator n=1 Tax=Actinomadura sp. HBU206391 TaxID=2731692 RepID=UPI00164F1527|nr:BTAD domain-containing putative transcriptional regulator [Actinomadura sp. HBU206391]MBC6457907.1 tetratricopeptide repeat protein [Actinomadura sp. HBU206391]
MGSDVHCGVLGPLLVTVGGQAVRMGADKQRALLAALALRAGRPVPYERLMDCVWGEEPPATARATLYSYARRLRQSLGSEGKRLIHSVPGGYLLDASAVRLDLLRFRELTAEADLWAERGDVAGEAACLRGALELWRGPALADVPSETLHREEVPRLAEERLSAQERRVDAELRLGRSRDVVGELRELTAQHPLRERFWSQLMVALHESGRTAEALAAYRLARDRLADELGLDPGENLRRLESSILRGDLVLPDAALNAAVPFGTTPSGTASGTAPSDATPSETAPSSATPSDAGASGIGRPGAGRPGAGRPGAGAPATGAAGASYWPFAPVTPRQLPPDTSDFVGRDEELRTLLQRLRSGPRAAVPIAAITGRAGVGKTALAVHAAHRLAAAFPDGQLYVDLRLAGTDPVDPAPVLARFLRNLGVDGGRIPADLEQRAETYRSIVSGRRFLIVLDNAADESQVRPLLPGSAGCAVIVTSRARLGGLDGVRPMELDVLTPDQAVALLRQVLGAERVAAAGTAAGDLVRMCGGLPLAVRIAAARLAAKPHWPVARMVTRLRNERDRLDELAYGGLEVRAGLALSYAGLDDAAKTMFRRAGLLDLPDFAGWAGAALVDATPAEAETALERLVDARLLDAVSPDAFGEVRYRFHDLVRLFARERAEAEESAAGRETTLGRAFAAWLAITERAHAAVQGGDFTIVHGAVPRHGLDRTLAERVDAHPVGWYETERVAISAVVRQAAQAGHDEVCWDLAVTAGTLFAVRSHYDEWAYTHEHALTATRRAGNRRGEAAVRESIGWLELAQGLHQAAEASIESAVRGFAEVGDAHGHAISLRTLAHLEWLRGRYERALRDFNRALPTIVAVGDHGAAAGALRGIGQIQLQLGRPDLAEGALERAVAEAGEARYGRGGVQALHALGECRLAQGRTGDAERAFVETLTLVREFEDLKGEIHALQGLGDLRLEQGRHQEAEGLLTDALSLIGEVGGASAVRAKVLLSLGRLRYTQGDHGAALGCLGHARRAGEQAEAPVLQARSLLAVGDVHQVCGDTAAAQAAWKQALDLFDSVGAEQARAVRARLRETPLSGGPLSGGPHGIAPTCR